MKQFDITNSTSVTTDQANLFQVYSESNGDYYYNLLKNLNFTNLDKMAPAYYITYQVAEGDVWTNIAYKFYNDYTLWWLICKFNAIQDPTSFPVAGTYIKIPTTAVKDLVISQIKGS